jgi:hypothetical protein
LKFDKAFGPVRALLAQPRSRAAVQCESHSLIAERVSVNHKLLSDRYLRGKYRRIDLAYWVRENPHPDIGGVEVEIVDMEPIVP